MLQAYFDASSRASGIFCVAGFAFAKSRLKKFETQWWTLFGKYGGCHMKDLVHRRGPFRGLSTAETDDLLKRAVAIIHRRMSYGIVVSCEVAEINSLLPRFIQGFEHAYPVCCHLAMLNLGIHLEEIGRPEKIAYFFETGDPFSSSAKKFMSNAAGMPILRDTYRYQSHEFIEKDKALALQSADLLAWEWGKYYDETVTLRKRNMRQSLAALLRRNNNQFDNSRYHLMHITGEPLRSWARKVTDLGLLELAEQRSL